MPKPLSEQVVVVVGASSGIGRATALALAERGARVVCAARSTEALRTLVERVERAGGRALAVPTDVADPLAVRAVADAAERHYGRIDTWVNLASVGVWGRIEDITDAEFERVLRVNFLGSVYGVRAALPALRRAGGGAIIRVASAEGVRSVPLQAPYTASKFALRAFQDALRIELAQEDARISVTTVLPASIDTPFFEHARSRLGGALPKPPPPVYAPEVVADAIIFAAEYPRREIPVGGAAAAFMLSQRLLPALTDAVLSLRRVGAGSQHAKQPDNGVDDVDAPLDGPGRVHGNHPGRVLRHSLFTRLIGCRRRRGNYSSPLSSGLAACGPRLLTSRAKAPPGAAAGATSGNPQSNSLQIRLPTRGLKSWVLSCGGLPVPVTSARRKDLFKVSSTPRCARACCA